MSRLMSAPLAALSLGISGIALAQAGAPLTEPAEHCGGGARPCGALPDDSRVERRGVAPNLERPAPGGDAFRVSIDGEGQG
jgi:hypothetical protein